MSEAVKVFQDSFLVGNIVLSIIIIYQGIHNWRCNHHWPDITAVVIGCAYLFAFSIILFSDAIDLSLWGSSVMRLINLFGLGLIVSLLIFRDGKKCK